MRRRERSEEGKEQIVYLAGLCSFSYLHGISSPFIVSKFNTGMNHLIKSKETIRVDSLGKLQTNVPLFPIVGYLTQPWGGGGYHGPASTR